MCVVSRAAIVHSCVLGESLTVRCGEPSSSSSFLLLPGAPPPPSTYSTKKRGWVAKEWPYQIRERSRERGKEEEEEDELCVSFLLQK